LLFEFYRKAGDAYTCRKVVGSGQSECSEFSRR